MKGDFITNDKVQSEHSQVAWPRIDTNKYEIIELTMDNPKKALGQGLGGAMLPTILQNYKMASIVVYLYGAIFEHSKK